MTTRVLVLTDDRLGPAMAGPAIRAWELATALASEASVTLVSLQPLGDLQSAPFEVVGLGANRLRALARDADVLLAGGLIYANAPWLLALDKVLVLDLYAPFLLEDMARLEGDLGELQHAQHRVLLDRQLLRADFMICASDRQRDYWLGRLCALGRLTPARTTTDPTLERLIAVVPFGLSMAPPVAGAPRLRAGRPQGERVFVWGGGLWEWLDPLTPIRAVARLAQDCPEVRLVFWAGPSPNPTTPEMPMSHQARELARELGVLDRSVSFLDTWVPYGERGSVLLEADAGVMAHLPQLESRFAFRTRALDYLWAGRPILCTHGDVMADLVEREGLGLTCAPGDTAAWALGFKRMARDEPFMARCAERIAAVRPRYFWPEVARPLVAFVASPQRDVAGAAPPAWALSAGASGTLAKAWQILRAEGARGLAERARRVRARHRAGPNA